MSAQDVTSDKELDALLNSALQDFDKPVPVTAAPVAKIVELDATTEAGASSVQPAVAPSGEELMDSKWTEEFIKQAAAQFEQNMQSLLSQGADGSNASELMGGLRPEELSENFHKMAEAAAQVLGNDNNQGDFTAAISQTLRNLSEGQENLQNPMSDDDLLNMFGGLGMNPGESGDFVPFMQNMMQSLLSKEVLYPALRDIVDKYPAWLEENAATLEPAEMERFVKQKDIMASVCSELEKESATDTVDQKNARFNKILELMQKLQDCGQPPTELVGDLNSVVNFDAQGNPQLPGIPPGVDPANCAVM